MDLDPLPDPRWDRPPVVFWFKVYCGVLCLLYFALAAVAVGLIFVDPAVLEMSALEARLMGVLFLGMGLGLFVISLLPLLLRPRPWVWTYDIVVIGLGMTSGCFLPFCIPLLIFWLRPETQRYFGKLEGGPPAFSEEDPKPQQ